MRNIPDDIIVHGQTREEHDKRLEEALKGFHERGLTLNKEKCKIHMSELEYMGHLLSSRGVGPSEAKVEAVTEANNVVVESTDGVQYKRNATHVKKFLERSNARECETSLLPPIPNSFTEHQTQPSVNGSDEHLEKLIHRRWSGVRQNPTLSRTLHADLSSLEHYQHGLRTLLCLSNRTFIRQSRLRT